MWKSKKQRAKSKWGIQDTRHETQEVRHKTRDMRQETGDRRYESLKSHVSSLESIPDVFKITEEPEEVMLDTGRKVERSSIEHRASSIEHPVSSIENIVEKLELLKAEVLKLGKAQIQTRMFAESEYRALREAIEAFPADSNHVAEMVVKELFSIADGLEAGVRAGKAISGPEIDSWLDGMKIVHQRVMRLLEKLDVHPLHSLGKPFDPSLHMAVAVEYTQEVNDNIILEEQRRGYMRGDKVIRYAEVVVNKQPREHAIQLEETDE